MSDQAKKHPCPDCQQCQWCTDDRCRLCLNGCAKPKLTIAEQIALYDKLNPPQPEVQRPSLNDLTDKSC